MSVATMRAAITAFLAQGCADGGPVPGVSRVYRAMPWYVDGSTWQLSADLGSGSVVFLDIPDDGGEERIAVPAVKGRKQVVYTVAVVVLYQYLIPSATSSPPVSEDAWVDGLDATLDGLKAWMRTDPNFGAPEVVFQAAQTDGDLKVVRDLPRRQPGKVVAWNAVTFHAIEMVVA